MKLKEAIKILQQIESRLSVNNIDNNPNLLIDIKSCRNRHDIVSIDCLTPAVVLIRSNDSCPAYEGD